MVLETPAELLRCIYISDEADADIAADAKALCEGAGISLETVAGKVFREISDTVTPQGIMAVVSMPEWDYEGILDSRGEGALLLFLENLQDPGNLGTILRTAEAAGADAIIADKNTVDLFNPKVVRSTMGGIYRMPFISVADLPSAVDAAKSRGIKFYAAHLSGKCDYSTPDYTGGTAFFIGNEGNGLTDETTALADEKIIIPMEGKTESLNAAMSAGILMYEAHRQRSTNVNLV